MFWVRPANFGKLGIISDTYILKHEMEQSNIMITKDQKYNIDYSEVRGDNLRPPQALSPASFN